MHRFTPNRTQTLAALAGLMLTGSLATAEIDEAALDRLGEAVQRNSEAETVAFDLRIDFRQSMGGHEHEEQAEARVSLARPDRFAIQTDGTSASLTTAVIDGERFYESVPMLNGYIERAAPADLASVWRGGELAADGSGGWVMTLGTLLDDELFNSLRGLVRHAEVVGEEAIDGETAERVHLRIGPMSEAEFLPAEMRQQMGELELVLDVWTTTQGQPEIRRIDPDAMTMMEQMMGDQMPPGQMPEISVELAMSGWRIDEPIDEAAFAYDPPEGARRGDSFQDLAMAYQEEMQQQQPQQQQGGAEGLVGEPAPTFDLELLEGGRMDLDDHLGRDVVVLDFWATWCGPCVRTMPVYQTIMEDYADQNVQVYAVNLQESEDQIVPFMEQHDLSMPVPMDSDGSVGQAYHARAIPQSVVIGLDGTVQAVHVGALPNLEDQLRDELETLLGGESLVD